MKEAFEVIYYEQEGGSCPIQEFLDSLGPKAAARTYAMIELLSEMGNDLRMPYSKHLEDGVFELRIQAANGISRILYFFYAGRRIVLTNGFIKKARKTPRGEIERAKRYRRDYLKREEMGCE